MTDPFDLIDQCVRGRAPRDVINEIEDELPDARTLTADLTEDFKRAGIRYDSVSADPRGHVRIQLPEDLSTVDREEARLILDVHIRTYPDVKFLIRN